MQSDAVRVLDVFPLFVLTLAQYPILHLISLTFLLL
jgi:hypothetical protein